MTKLYYEFIIKLINLFPEVEPLRVPEGIEDGFVNMFGLFGFFFPYKLYAPLFTFIIALTLFRISWSVFVTFKK